MTQGSDGEEAVARGELVPAVPPGAMREWAELLVAQAREEGVALTGEGGPIDGHDAARVADRPRGRDGRAGGARCYTSTKV